MNRKKCKHCREYFRPEKRLQHYCLKAECVEAWVISLREAQWKKRKKQIKEELKTLEDYYQEALKAFNAYIRERDKNKPCVSCGAKEGTYRITSGHYFPQGQNRSIALDERNAHGQCWYNCNSNKSGNLSEYLPELINRIGQDGYDELQRLRHETKKYNRDDLKAIREDYKEKLKELRRN